MYKNDDHNSWMMLALVNTLQNQGTITGEERNDILELGEMIEEHHLIGNAVDLVATLKKLKG